MSRRPKRAAISLIIATFPTRARNPTRSPVLHHRWIARSSRHPADVAAADDLTDLRSLYGIASMVGTDHGRRLSLGGPYASRAGPSWSAARRLSNVLASFDDPNCPTIETATPPVFVEHRRCAPNSSGRQSQTRLTSVCFRRERTASRVYLHDTYATAEENVREGLDEFGVKVCPVPEHQSEMTEGPSIADAYAEKRRVRPG